MRRAKRRSRRSRGPEDPRSRVISLNRGRGSAVRATTGLGQVSSFDSVPRSALASAPGRAGGTEEAEVNSSPPSGPGLWGAGGSPFGGGPPRRLITTRASISISRAYAGTTRTRTAPGAEVGWHRWAKTHGPSDNPVVTEGQLIRLAGQGEQARTVAPAIVPEVTKPSACSSSMGAGPRSNSHHTVGKASAL
jgi:hypothetical protein